MSRKLKPKILELRSKGLSYSQIQNELKCSKSTISFHLKEKTRILTNRRKSKQRKKNPLIEKIKKFSRKNHKLYVKLSQFRKTKGKGPSKNMFNQKELIEKIGSNPTCYLTGKPINLNDSSSYALDHIVPRSKGGDNSLANCGLTCIEANQAKHSMNYDDFIQLCYDVIKHYERKSTLPVLSSN